MSKIYLFTGIETFHWDLSNFHRLCSYCLLHNIDGVIIKIYEYEKGEWYAALGYAKAIQALVTGYGLEFIPYGYFYGLADTQEKELHDLPTFLKAYDRFILNLEDKWDNSANGATQKFVDVLKQYPHCEIWVSTWANPADHGWLENMKLFNEVVTVWMPEEYFDSLIQKRLDQYPSWLKGEISPTYCMQNNVSIDRIGSSPHPSIWVYQENAMNDQWIDACVAHVKGGQSMVQLNSQGCVLDVRESYQLEPGESQDLCGPWSVASLLFSGLPGKGPRGSAEDIDNWVDTHVDRVNFQGSSIPDMYNFIVAAMDPQSKQRGLHFCDIPATKECISIAVRAGYPVIFTANEQNIREVKTGKRPPYPWNLNANHVLPVIGLDTDGNFICADELNNKFQGYWPVIYDSSVLNPSWATVIQLVGPDSSAPWHKGIPSNDPRNWPKGFSAQNFTTEGPPPVTEDFTKELHDVWLSVIPDLLQGTGIYQSWATAYKQNVRLGAPITREFSTTSSMGQPMIVQVFSGALCYWINNTANWFDIDKGPFHY